MSDEIRISAYVWNMPPPPEDVFISRSVENRLRNTNLLEAGISRSAEGEIIGGFIREEEISRSAESMFIQSIQETEISRSVEDDVQYFYQEFTSDIFRFMANITWPQSEVNELCRAITYIEDPIVSLSEEIRIRAVPTASEPTRDFEVKFSDLYSQKVGLQVDARNQFDAFCTLVWVGTFDNNTRFAVCYRDHIGGSAIPIDESLPKTISLTPTFSWSSAYDANQPPDQVLRYDLQIAEHFTMKTLLHEELDISGSSFVCPVTLEVGKTYYWRMRTKDYATLGGMRLLDTSDWTNVYSFEVASNIITTIPATSSLTWDHPFLLGERQRYYFWDTRNMSPIDPDVYIPVVYKYQFNSERTEVIGDVAAVDGSSFSINHLSANPPMFLSAVLDEQTSRVAIQIQINDTMGRLYQVNDFYYLDNVEGVFVWLPIQDSRIVGKKSDLRSQIAHTTNRLLISWNGSADPDVQIDQDMLYNLRFLNEPRHRNNNFYWQLEYLDSSDLYNILTTYHVDFGTYWGTIYYNNDLPIIEDMTQFEDYSKDIRFFNQGWTQLQIEVRDKATFVVTTYDTGAISFNHNLCQFTENTAVVSHSDYSDTETIEPVSQNNFYKLYDITDIVRSVYGRDSMTIPFHIYCELRWDQPTPAVWGETSWGSGSWGERSWGADSPSDDFADPYLDSHIINDGENNIYLNTIKDFKYFTCMNDFDDPDTIQFNGITHMLVDRQRIIMKVPVWVDDEIEVRIRLVSIDSGEYKFSLYKGFEDTPSKRETQLTVNPSAEISLSLPGNVEAYDCEFRYRGLDLVSGWSTWTRFITRIPIISNRPYVYGDDIVMKTAEHKPDYDDIKTWRSAILYFGIYNSSRTAIEYSYFSGVDYDDTNIIFEASQNDKYFEPISGLIPDWDLQSRFRVKVIGWDTTFPTHRYKFGIVDSLEDGWEARMIVFEDLAVLDYVYSIARDHNEISSDDIRDFDNCNVDSNIPLFEWSKIRTQNNGDITFDLRNDYTVEEIEFDFYQYPDKLFQCFIYDTVYSKWKKVAHFNNGLYFKFLMRSHYLRISKVRIVFESSSPVLMKVPRVMGYRLAPETVDPDSFTFVDTEETDIVMQDWSPIEVELDPGEIIDPADYGYPDLPKFAKLREGHRKARVSLFRDPDGFTLLYAKSGLKEFEIIFTSYELYSNDVTNIVLDWKSIEETFYELTYENIDRLEQKLQGADYWVACRGSDGMEFSPWSEFAKRVPANVHTFLWDITGMSIKPTKHMYIKCKATLSSPTVKMSSPVLGFTTNSNNEIVLLEAERESISTFRSMLEEQANELQEMIDDRIDPTTTQLPIAWGP